LDTKRSGRPCSNARGGEKKEDGKPPHPKKLTTTQMVGRETACMGKFKSRTAECTSIKYRGKAEPERIGKKNEEVPY